MSTYYDMSISHMTYTEIELAIIKALKHSDDWTDMVELVHLLDVWNEMKDEASSKNSKDIKKWMEQQKLFEEREVKNIFLYHKIKKVLEENCVNKDIESEFHLICDLADIFEKEWSKRENENQNNEQED